MVIMVIINITVIIIHVIMIIIPRHQMTDRSGHTRSLAGEGDNLLGFVLHCCQGLLDCLLPHLTVIPANSFHITQL